MAGSPAIWLDGERTTALPLPDRGLDFGDGLFETLLVNQSRILFPQLHMQRLEHGLATLRFPDTDSNTMALVGQQLTLACEAIQSWRWAALRLTVTRGQGPRGYAPPAHPAPRIIIIATQLESNHQAMRPAAQLALASIRWSSQPALAGLKHLNRLEQVLAAAQAREAGADEALMLGQQGNAISVSSGNLFIVTGGRLLTPAIVDSGIAGTRRRRVMELWAPAIGLAAEEATLSTADLESADEVFYSNSLVGLRPVASFGGRQWLDHPVCEALYSQYLGEMV